MAREPLSQRGGGSCCASSAPTIALPCLDALDHAQGIVIKQRHLERGLLYGATQSQRVVGCRFLRLP
jgi:hypothetical protein